MHLVLAHALAAVFKSGVSCVAHDHARPQHKPALSTRAKHAVEVTATRKNGEYMLGHGLPGCEHRVGDIPKLWSFNGRLGAAWK